MIQHLAEGAFDVEKGLMPQSDSGEDGALSTLPLLLVVALVPGALCPSMMKPLAGFRGFIIHAEKGPMQTP